MNTNNVFKQRVNAIRAGPLSFNFLILLDNLPVPDLTVFLYKRKLPEKYVFLA